MVPYRGKPCCLHAPSNGFWESGGRDACYGSIFHLARSVVPSFRPSIRHTTYTYYVHVESKPSSGEEEKVCQGLWRTKGPQLVSVIGSSILECYFSPRFGHLLDSYKLGQFLPLVTPTNILYPSYTVIIHSYIAHRYNLQTGLYSSITHHIDRTSLY